MSNNQNHQNEKDQPQSLLEPLLNDDKLKKNNLEQMEKQKIKKNNKKENLMKIELQQLGPQKNQNKERFNEEYFQEMFVDLIQHKISITEDLNQHKISKTEDLIQHKISKTEDLNQHKISKTEELNQHKISKTKESLKGNKLARTKTRLNSKPDDEFIQQEIERQNWLFQRVFSKKKSISTKRDREIKIQIQKLSRKERKEWLRWIKDQFTQIQKQSEEQKGNLLQNKKDDFIPWSTLSDNKINQLHGKNVSKILIFLLKVAEIQGSQIENLTWVEYEDMRDFQSVLTSRDYMSDFQSVLTSRDYMSGKITTTDELREKLQSFKFQFGYDEEYKNYQEDQLICQYLKEAKSKDKEFIKWQNLKKQCLRQKERQTNKHEKVINPKGKYDKYQGQRNKTRHHCQNQELVPNKMRYNDFKKIIVKQEDQWLLCRSLEQEENHVILQHHYQLQNLKDSEENEEDDSESILVFFFTSICFGPFAIIPQYSLKIGPVKQSGIKAFLELFIFNFCLWIVGPGPYFLNLFGYEINHCLFLNAYKRGFLLFLYVLYEEIKEHLFRAEKNQNDQNQKLFFFDENTFDFQLISYGQKQRIEGNKMKPYPFYQLDCHELKKRYYILVFIHQLLFTVILNSNSGNSATEEKFIGNNTFEYVQVGLEFLISLYISALLLTFTLEAIQVHRSFKNYLQNLLEIQNFNCSTQQLDDFYNQSQLGHQVDCSGLEKNGKHRLHQNVITGPIDLLEPDNIRSLTILRQCAFEEIKQITSSSQLFLTVALILLVVFDYSLYYLSKWLFSKPKVNQDDLIAFLIVFNGFYTLPLIIVFITIFYYAAKINAFYGLQESVIQKQSSDVKTIQNASERYIEFHDGEHARERQLDIKIYKFSEGEKEKDEKVYNLGKEGKKLKDLSKEEKDQIYDEFDKLTSAYETKDLKDNEFAIGSSSSNGKISYIVKSMVQQYKTQQVINDEFGKLTSAYETFIEYITQDKANNQFKFLGLFVVNKQSLSGVGGGIGYLLGKNFQTIYKYIQKKV